MNRLSKYFARVLFTLLLFGGAGGAVSAGAEDLDLSVFGTLKSNGIRHVTVAEAKQIIETHPEVVVLDVRTGREFRNGHIKGAININYFSWSFREKIAELDKNLTYVIHCKSGGRSGWAAPILKSFEITSVVHMDGGTDAWIEASYPFGLD